MPKRVQLSRQKGHRMPTHAVIVTVRGPRREDGSEGPTAAIRLSMTTFGDLVREWDEQHVEAGFSAARQVDLANKREDSPAEGTAPDPRQAALDRMVENAEELGLYDDSPTKGRER